MKGIERACNSKVYVDLSPKIMYINYRVAPFLVLEQWFSKWDPWTQHPLPETLSAMQILRPYPVSWGEPSNLYFNKPSR